MEILSDFKKSKLFLSIVLTVVLMTTLLSAVVYAHNDNDSTKAVNVLGYEYVNNTTLKIFFDKGLVNLDQGQFKIEPAAGGSPVTISGMATSLGTGWTHTYSPKGTIVTLTTASLSSDTRYKVTVSSTVQMGNSTAMTVGNYLLHNDVVFYFWTKDSNGNYTASPEFTFLPTSTNAGLSSNVTAISDIPIKTAGLTLSDMKLTKGGVDVVVDTTLDTNPYTGAEGYSTQINDAHTCIFIPLTLKGGVPSPPSYNLASEGTQYTFVVPDYIQSINDGDFSDTDYQFTTGHDTAACTGTITPSVTGYTASSVSLSWSEVTDTLTGPIPDHYHVYYSTNPYFGFVKSTDTVTDNGSTDSCTVTGLSSSTTYYFRIVPANVSDEEGGFSPYSSQATN